MLLANMEYAGVSGAVITQEEIDGNQDAYLCSVRQQHPDRFRVCSLYEEGRAYTLDGVDGIKLCGGRLSEQDLTKHERMHFKSTYNHFPSTGLSFWSLGRCERMILNV